MFGFHSFSEAPFSAQAGVSQSGAALLQASGELILSGSLYITSQSTLDNSGILTSNNSLYISSQDLLEGSGELSSNGTFYITSQSLLQNSGELISNGTMTVSAANLLEGSGTLGPDGSLLASGASLLLDAGTLTSNGTLIHGVQSALEASGTLGSDGSNALTSATLKLNAGTLTSNGTLYITSDSVESASGTLTSNPSLYNTSQSLLEASGTLGSNATMGVDGASLLLHAGTLTAYGTLLSTSSSLLENSGTLSSNGTMGVDGATLKLNSGTLGANGTLIHGADIALSGSGIITSNNTLINSGKTSVVNSGELLPGGSLLAVSDSTISGSGAITSNIMVLRGIEAVVGITYDEFAKTTQRLNYKPALPRLKNNDIALDFAINEGAGSVFSSTSRRQKGTTGNLSWGRVDGRMSLTSPGGANDYRITASSNGLNFDNTTIYISFKPTVSYPFNVFLFNMRGTGQNNNEIDIYCVTSQQKLFIDVYDGTTLQRTEIPNVSINTWHNLAVTIGTDLKAYLNGDLQATYPSIVLPSVIGSNIYVGGTAGNDQAFRGSIDHFRWYNRQLSAIEVANLSKNISQDYYFNNLVPNHYEMSRVTGGSPVLSHNIAASLLGQGTIPYAFPWLGGAYFESSGTLSANGVILSELDVVPFTAYINQIEDSTSNIYQIYNKTMNVNRLYTKSLEK